MRPSILIVPIGAGKAKMGYTHYFEQQRSFTQDEWEKIAVDTIKILEYCDSWGIEITYEEDDTDQAEVSDSKIRFNGYKEGYETFVLTKIIDKENDFNFCKTARKPYDLAVGLVLLIAKKHAPNSIRVSSDGDWDFDWQRIRDAYKDIFKEYPECCFSDPTPSF